MNYFLSKFLFVEKLKCHLPITASWLYHFDLKVVREQTSCTREMLRKNKHVMRKAINTTKLAVDQCISYLYAASIANRMKQSNAPPGSCKTATHQAPTREFHFTRQFVDFCRPRSCLLNKIFEHWKTVNQ